MLTFLTIISWVFLILSAARVYFILIELRDPETRYLIRMAEVCGWNPVGDSLLKPIILFIVSLCWIISTFLN